MTVLDQDILRVSANFELGDGTQYQNVYHYVRDGEDPVSDENHIAGIASQIEDIYDELLQHIQINVSEQLCFVDRVEFNEIVDDWRVVENIGTFTITFTPNGGLEELPHQVSPFVVFKTGRPRTVGKKFFFPFREADSVGGILESAAVAALTAAALEVLQTIVLGGDATLTPGVPRTGVGSWYNFLVAVVTDVVGTQRRRRQGVGA